MRDTNNNANNHEAKSFRDSLESYGKPLSQTCINLLQSICRCRRVRWQLHLGSKRRLQRKGRKGRKGSRKRAKLCSKQQRYLRYSEMIHPESSRYIQIHGTQQFVMDEALIRQWFTAFIVAENWWKLRQPIFQGRHHPSPHCARAAWGPGLAALVSVGSVVSVSENMFFAK